MTQDDLRAAMWSMPHSERCAMLSISILKDKKNDPALAVRNIIKFATDLAKQLNTHDRYRIAETMRDWADELEHLRKGTVA
ncbi:hypothetical protein [Bradyrhizobium sp. URHC0002]